VRTPRKVSREVRLGDYGALGGTRVGTESHPNLNSPDPQPILDSARLTEKPRNAATFASRPSYRDPQSFPRGLVVHGKAVR